MFPCLLIIKDWCIVINKVTGSHISRFYYLLHGTAVPVSLPIGGADRLHHVNAGLAAGAVGLPLLADHTLSSSGTSDTRAGITGAVVDCGEATPSSTALLLCRRSSTFSSAVAGAGNESSLSLSKLC